MGHAIGAEVLPRPQDHPDGHQDPGTDAGLRRTLAGVRFRSQDGQDRHHHLGVPLQVHHEGQDAGLVVLGQRVQQGALAAEFFVWIGCYYAFIVKLLYYKNELKVDATTVELFVEFVQIQNYRLEEKYFYFHQKRWVHF